MSTIDTAVADKDQLLEFAKTEYNVVIDPRTKIETIRERVQGLINGVAPAVIAEDVAPAKAPDIKYVKSVVNGNVYEWHEYLVGVDFIPCTAEGVIV
jgi:hypothetical protein